MAKKKQAKVKQNEIIALDLVKRLSGLGNVTHKKMFGGVGIFCDGKMFALVSSRAVPYLKTDAKTVGKFQKEGAEQFHNMRYHEIPDSVIADTRKLKTWAKKSIDIALGR